MLYGLGLGEIKVFECKKEIFSKRFGLDEKTLITDIDDSEENEILCLADFKGNVCVLDDKNGELVKQDEDLCLEKPVLKLILLKQERD